MGMLLTFMFLWNRIGALVLIPALSHFLLPDRRQTVVDAPLVDGATATAVLPLRQPAAPDENRKPSPSMRQAAVR